MGHRQSSCESCGAGLTDRSGRCSYCGRIVASPEPEIAPDDSGEDILEGEDVLDPRWLYWQPGMSSAEMEAFHTEALRTAQSHLELAAKNYDETRLRYYPLRPATPPRLQPAQSILGLIFQSLGWAQVPPPVTPPQREGIIWNHPAVEEASQQYKQALEGLRMTNYKITSNRLRAELYERGELR